MLIFVHWCPEQPENGSAQFVEGAQCLDEISIVLSVNAIELTGESLQGSLRLALHLFTKVIRDEEIMSRPLISH